MQHRCNVLDVVRAVTQIAPEHPEIAVWWYVPRLLDNPNIEILVEAEDGEPADFTALAGKIGALLEESHVAVAPHPGPGETRRLFRVLTRRRTVPQGGSPRPDAGGLRTTPPDH